MPYTPLENSEGRANHGIEHNPSVACQKCGQEERWVAIQERGDWQVSSDPDVPFLCPNCI
jgi:hypothetical protein